MGEKAGDLSTRFYDRLRTGGGQIPDTQLEEFKSELNQLNPLITAFYNIVDQSDYELEALSTGLDPITAQDVPVPNYVDPYHTTVSLLRLQVLIHSKEGNHEEALELAHTMIKSSHSHPYSILFIQLLALAGINSGGSAWRGAVEACDDAMLLRRSLDYQTRLRPELSQIQRSIPLL